jgi:hypothetical protein
MSEIILNVALTSILLSLVLSISKTNPVLGGFILSMPLSTLITLAFSRLQSRDPGNTMMLAKSIFVGLPTSLVFFIPFFFAERLKISFWTCYAAGVVCLSAGFFVHRYLTKFL